MARQPMDNYVLYVIFLSLSWLHICLDRKHLFYLKIPIFYETNIIKFELSHHIKNLVWPVLQNSVTIDWFKPQAHYAHLDSRLEALDFKKVYQTNTFRYPQKIKNSFRLTRIVSSWSVFRFAQIFLNTSASVVHLTEYFLFKPSRMPIVSVCTSWMCHPGERETFHKMI